MSLHARADFPTWPATWGGVVIQTGFADPASCGDTATDTIHAEEKKLKMDPHSTPGAVRRGDSGDEEIWEVRAAEEDAVGTEAIDRK